MKFKTGVSTGIAGINGEVISLWWQMGYALGVAEESFVNRGYDLVVTALLDGEHNPGSLHPQGRAADLRVKQMTNECAIAIYEEVKTKLFPLGFDVVWEGGVGATPATTGAHIHIEYDPKVGRDTIAVSVG